VLYIDKKKVNKKSYSLDSVGAIRNGVARGRILEYLLKILIKCRIR